MFQLSYTIEENMGEKVDDIFASLDLYKTQNLWLAPSRILFLQVYKDLKSNPRGQASLC